MKTFALLAALALVAGSQARICIDSGTKALSISSSCTGGLLNREYLLEDITQVTVRVYKKVGNAKIAEFQLSNANGEEQATGSLDNIEADTYYVTVDATKALGTGEAFSDFFRGYDGDNWVQEGSECSNTDLFKGKSSDVTINGDGTSQNVRIFMEPCHNDITFGGNNGLPSIDVPQYQWPSYATQIAQLGSGPVGSTLKSGSTVTISVTLKNPNARNRRFNANAMRASFSTTGDKRASTPVWTLANDVKTHQLTRAPESYYTGKSIAYADANAAVPVTNGRLSEFQFQYVVGTDAENTYTTRLSFTPFAYDTNDRSITYDETTGYNVAVDQSAKVEHDVDKFREGTESTFDFIVAPVGDLDLEVLYFTGLKLRCDLGGPVFSTCSQNSFSPNFFKLTDESYINQNTQEQCAYPNKDEKGVFADGWQYVVPHSQPTFYDMEFEYTSLYGLDRRFEFAASVVSGDCDVAITGDTFEDVKGTPRPSNTELTYPVEIKITPQVSLAPNSIPTNWYTCVIKVTGTSKGLPSDDNVDNIERAVSAQFEVKVASTEAVCDYPTWVNGEYYIADTDQDAPVESIAAIEEFGTSTPCPSIRAISWENSHFSQSAACDDSSDGPDGKYVVKFCATMPKNFENKYGETDFFLDIYGFENAQGQGYFPAMVDDTFRTTEDTSACIEALNLLDDKIQLELEIKAYKVVVNKGEFKTHQSISGLCTAGTYGARIRASDYAGRSVHDTPPTCRSAAEYASYSGSGDAIDFNTFCPGAKNGVTGACINSRKRRKLLASAPGCPSGPFACPAENQMPFDIKIEDGRLSVSMDTSVIGDNQVVINANPVGLTPTRSKFIASDFATFSSSWTPTLTTKLDMVFQDANMKQDIKPGATVESLVACCSFSLEEAQVLQKSMAQILQSETTQLYRPVITIGGGNTGSTSNQNQQTTKTQTTSTHTEKSSDDSSSGGSLLVVVAVAAVLVLVAVIALAIFTVKSNKQSQRVVDLRGGNDKQSSWQKGGAMESDF